MSGENTPLVSFIVPCYNLAHLLTECVGSILDQSYQHLEVLIMDDCSPDNTAEVAASFNDPRVKHIRNEVNLRHLANYNKGIALATGEYIWLISADDRLRRPHIVERFVQLMEANPQVGFVFCPAMKFKDDGETTIYGAYGEADAIFNGPEFLRDKLLKGNGVCAPAGMVRRQCYKQCGSFPLDLPFAGDWYMWCTFSFSFDVGYLAEPMVGYRDHELNMTKAFMARADALIGDDFKVLWRIHQMAKDAEDLEFVRVSEGAIAAHYSYRVADKIRDIASIGLTLDEFETSLQQHCTDTVLTAQIMATVYAKAGDQHYDERDFETARRCYARAIRENPSSLRTCVKYALLRTGKVGRGVRNSLVQIRGTSKAKETSYQ
jgi:glycosyltransferase involved in cell wall biosynthesis